MTKKKNVVMFPNVERRLIELALRAVSEKRFVEAMEYFREMDQLQIHTEQTKFAKVICYFELGETENAIDYCEELLEEQKWRESSTVQIYFTLLVQNNDYNRLKMAIKKVESNRFLSQEFREQLKHLYQFVNKTVSSQESYHPERDWEQALATTKGIEAQISLVQSLTNQEYEKNIHTFETFLRNESEENVLKTLLLERFIDLNIEESFVVKKFNNTKVWSSTLSGTIWDMLYCREVLEKLEEELGTENPTLFEGMKDFFYQWMLIFYPFEPQESNPNVMAAALHYLGYMWHGIDVEASEWESRYGVSMDKISKFVTEIQEFERKYFALK